MWPLSARSRSRSGSNEPVLRSLEGQHEVAAENDADLLRTDGHRCLVIAEKARDQEQVILVGIQLGALVGVEDVLQHQWVQVESAAHLRHQGGIMQAVNVEPQRAVCWR